MLPEGRWEGGKTGHDDEKHTRESAVARLAATYRNVLEEFYASGAKNLRLLPISGGIFGPPESPPATIAKKSRFDPCASCGGPASSERCPVLATRTFYLANQLGENINTAL